MHHLLLDVRFAARALHRNPGFAALATLALALGIGANTAIFSVADAVLLRPLPYPDASRLASLFGTDIKRHDTHDVISYPTFLDWKNQQQSFEDLAAFSGWEFDLSGENEPERIPALRVSAGLFPLLQVRPALGQAFTAEEAQPGKNHVVLLSHGFWTRRFARNPDIVGKTIKFTGDTYTVAGVMSPTFLFPADRRIDAWVPLAPDPSRGHGFLHVAGRLKAGVSLARARSEMDAIAARLEKEYAGDQQGFGANVVSMHEQVVANARPALLIFLGAVGLVLVIACANVANMFLARATAREKETAVRAALGASRARLVRQWLTESVVVAMLGGAAGVLLAYWAADVLASWLSRVDVPIRVLDAVPINGSVLGFTLLVSVASGLLSGLAPALQAGRGTLLEQLRGAGRRRRRLTTSGYLVVSEVALSLVLLIGAGLLLRSFLLLRSVSPGFHPARLLTLRVDLPRNRFPEPGRRVEFYRQVLQKMEALPDVRSAAATSILPLSGDSATESFRVAGRPRTPGDLRSAGFAAVSEHYFKAMGIPLLSGRAFDAGDSGPRPLVALVTHAMARRVWPDQNPIGQHISILNRDREVVGIVGDVRGQGLEKDPRPEMYVPYLQEPAPGANFILESDTPSRLVAGARQAVWSVNPDLPVTRIATLEQVVTDSIAPQRSNSVLVGIFAALALALAAAGIYGVFSYSVSRQTREIGIRMALGAKSSEVLGLVLRHAMRLAILGIAIGLAGAFALTRLLGGLLYGITATDPWTFAGVSAFLAAVAMAAAYVPARRATRIDPMEALRYE